MLRLISCLLIPVLLGLTACATNPVTGRSELSMLSRAQEIAIGQQQYGPSQQSQGGVYTSDPALTAYVSEVGQRVAAVSDNPLPYEFVVLNNSVPNAWALPGGKIAVNRGLLLEFSNEAELAAVLGHEVVHAAARHGAQAVTRGTLLQGVVMVGALATMDNQYSDFIVGGAQLGAQLITQRYGRDAEREADLYGIRYMVAAGYDPQAAVTLQEVFVRLSEGRNQDWLNGLFASHPPSEERVRNNQALVDELRPSLAGRDLELGELRYQQAISGIKQTQPAYELMAQAEEEINNRDLPAALNLLDRAIDMAPNEARFYGLKGDILLYQERHQQAIAVYNEALALDQNYFDYYLGRGVARARLGQTQQARADLERSAELLPTAMAMNELGQMALAGNDRNAAKEYFQMAASGQGALAEQATQSYIRLDILDNPQAYLQAETLVDENGQIVIRVSNPTELGLRNVALTITLSAGGANTRASRTISSLAGRSAVNVATGLQMPMDFVAGADAVRTSVTSLELR